MMPERPTPAELTAFLDGEKAQVKGRIVLVGKHTLVPVNINPPAKRRDRRAGARAVRSEQSERAGRGRGGRGDQPAPPMTARQIDEQVDAFLVANGAKVRVNDAAREHGQIIAFNNRTYDVAKAVPTVVMRNEDYGRISRILADGTPVELEFNIVNKVYPEGRTAYNTIAEIPGTDKKDEIVMLGGHLDSWHVGDRRHRQRHRLRDDDGGGADSEGDRRDAAAHDSRRAVERRRSRGCSARRPT